MHARNRRTGARITGTLEHVPGEANLIPGGFGRTEGGRLTHEHAAGTRMFWDSSEQVTANGERIYLDENDEHVVESGIELYDDTAEPAAPAPTLPAPRAPKDPDADARGVAERFVASMQADVDDYYEKLAAARETGRAWGEEDAEKAVAEAREAFVRSAGAGVEGVDVATCLVDLATARNALAPIIRHVDTAVIRIEGPNAVRLHCRRSAGRFRVEQVSAREYGHISHVEPAKTAAVQADIYASAILQAWGL